MECPECHSVDITFEQGFHSKDRMEPDEPAGWYCLNCEHTWVEEDDAEDAGDHERDLRRDLKQENENG